MRTKQASDLSRAEATGSVLAVSHADLRAFGVMAQERRLLMETDHAYYFGVFLNATGEFVGEVMLVGVERGDQQNAVIGTVIYSPFRRRRFGKEASRACIRYAFERLKLHRIEGQADPDNHASIAMCHLIGFKTECVSPKRVKEGGRWRDRVVLSITRDEL